MYNSKMKIRNDKRIRRITFMMDEMSIIVAFLLAIVIRFKEIMKWVDFNYGIYVSLFITSLIFETLVYFIYDYSGPNIVAMDPIDNFFMAFKSRVLLQMLSLGYLFVVQRSILASRIVIGIFSVLSVVLGYIIRMVYRYYYIKKNGDSIFPMVYKIKSDNIDINHIKEEIDIGDYESVLLFTNMMDEKKANEYLQELRKMGIRTYVSLNYEDYEIRSGIITDIDTYEAMPAFVGSEKCRIFGINYSISRIEEAVHHVLKYIDELKGQYICFSNVHTSVVARENHDYLNTLNGAAFVFPDGAPIYRVEKMRGFVGAERVAGPDFMENMFRDTMDGKVSHFFYGSTEKTLANLRENLQMVYPGLNVKGMYSPPFRKLTPEEDAEVIKMINESGADIVWVGLGAPKQEEWMRDHKGKINAVMMGVGAGFDFHAGTLKRAPLWIRRVGLEWLFRLFKEPARLFKRYVVNNIKFMVYLLTDKTREAEYYHTKKKQIFCIGCKGVPAEYGGFETFMDNLTKYRHRDDIRYHIARIADSNGRYIYNDAKCFDVKTPQVGAGRAVIYDLRALRRCVNYCKERPEITDPIFFIMACRIGPFMGHYKRKIEKLGGKVILNPDGHDWSRRKWSRPVRAYWKLSEKLMVKHADRIVCDSQEIEKYINKEYACYNPNTTYIAYGAELTASAYADDSDVFVNWLKDNSTSAGEYYIVVGRFVEENNFDIIIREFMKTSTDKKLIIITTTNDKLAMTINKQLNYQNDERIIISKPIYDKELVKKIRENAFAYIHGHEVGGTNPSLLEALASTSVNLVLDVKYNREVVQDAGLYWYKDEGNLAEVISQVETLGSDGRKAMDFKAKKRIKDHYTWDYISQKYEEEFC
ncbi:polymer biosynthesis protein, WecB/TagA/CpsF family [Butyrivibrio proteoclasticus]|uniref:Polymer biosynthesis protein, WecB/TagA/CpsF family n=1 Tax=Butyrivibrio proteoclasticus TaxID=43305 RepID=A0A1I5PT59_9FIRM|nr:WecB/TagA/CpsF family glycosyltransferase [Butyrivibrio proteoclasticus]SFP37127.1 polymer biosynthesis protein, WecB/TagA/CpsF family [Butyrivibrio proteoclasticus]